MGRQNGVLSHLELSVLSIPDYQTLMLPVLESLADGEEHRLRDITDRIAERFNLTEDERRQLLPSGQQTIISNRVGWARAYLKKAGLVDNPARGALRITEEDRLALSAADVAKLLNISTRHLWSLNSSGRLPRPIRFGRATRWRAEELREWLAAGAPPRDSWEAQCDRAMD